MPTATLAPADFPLVRQAGAAWELYCGDEVLAIADTYAEVVRQLAEMVGVDSAPGSSDGLLAETWMGDPAIAFNEQPDPERDFTNVKWGWRDPALSLVPLMLQTSTEMGHFGAVLAGFIEAFDLTGTGEPTATGRFYDSEAGRQARDLLLGGRRFGVSVDPDSDTAADYLCMEEDEDGFCTAAMWSFTYYSIAGLTMTPFPAFARANIVLGSPAEVEVAPEEAVEAVELDGLAASAPVAVIDRRVRPPRAWFTMPEPEFGDPLLVQQDLAGERWGVPQTITDEGQVFGHLALWGECLRNGSDLCIQPPDSARAYAEFMCGPGVRTAEGELVGTGTMVVGCSHYPTSGVDRSSFSIVRDYYANAGLGWADVRVSSGAFGVWYTGRVRPEVTEAQLSVLQSLPPSGDWSRDPEGAFELCAVLSVNKPGYPVRREAIAAAALPADSLVDGAAVSASVIGRTVMALTGANRVRPCPECAQRHAAAQTATRRDSGQLARIEALLQRIDRRTQHLNGAGIKAAAALLAPTIRD